MEKEVGVIAPPSVPLLKLTIMKMKRNIFRVSYLMEKLEAVNLMVFARVLFLTKVLDLYLIKMVNIMKMNATQMGVSGKN